MLAACLAVQGSFVLDRELLERGEYRMEPVSNRSMAQAEKWDDAFVAPVADSERAFVQRESELSRVQKLAATKTNKFFPRAFFFVFCHPPTPREVSPFELQAKNFGAK